MSNFSLNLTGKKVLITGGSKGIGKAIAELMAAEGCELHLAARTMADLEKIRRDLSDTYDATVHIHSADLSIQSEVLALAKACKDIDILINNAGAIPVGNIASIDDRTWTFSAFAYTFLSFDVELDGWLTNAPHLTKTETRVLDKLPYLRTLLCECETAAVEGKNKDILTMICQVRNLLDLWENCIVARLKTKNCQGD